MNCRPVLNRWLGVTVLHAPGGWRAQARKGVRFRSIPFYVYQPEAGPRPLMVGGIL
jgi:hypothetical protein